MQHPRTFSLAPRLLAAVLMGSVASLSVPSVALAQGAAAAKKAPTEKEKKDAREAYTAGEKAYAADDFAAAESSFRKAYSIIPTPHAEYWIAKSIDKQLKIVEAIEAYSSFLSNPDHARAGADKVDDAKSRLDTLKQTPAELQLTTEPAGASVTVDGQAQMGETPMTLKLAPGKHRIEVSSSGYETQVVELDLVPGGKATENVALAEAQLAPVTPVAPPPPEEPDVGPEPEPESRSKLPAYITLGVAGASAIVGTIFGISALGAKSDYDDNPTADRADDVERNALIADMAFGVAITLGITGVVLLVTGNDDPAAEARRLQKKRWAGFQVSPYMAPSGGGAAASFRF
ncbi:MAG: PEGA domain-containing protein [Polyangiaceae bacterium]|nr:PEGA domain-containing protein [Polyangiaceae bacterium]